MINRSIRGVLLDLHSTDILEFKQPNNMVIQIKDNHEAQYFA